MSEILNAERWIVAKLEQAQQDALAADPAFVRLRFHNESVPQTYGEGDPPAGQRPYWPCYVFRLINSQGDSQGNSGNIVYANLMYLVECINRDSSFSTIEGYANLAEAALHRQFNNQQGTVVASVRQRPFKRKETHQGIEYQRLGAEYLIQVEP